MARIRTVKPEFWSSEQVMECSPMTRLLFIGLWNFCDDAGNHVNSERTIKAQVFPGDDITSSDVRRMLDELSSNGLVVFYVHDGKEYLHVTGWAKHQRIEKPTYKYPPYNEGDSEPSRRPVVDSSTPEGNGMEGNGEEGKGREASSRKRAPSKSPLPDDFGISDRVRAWAAEKGHDRLDKHLESFRGKAAAKGYTYADWDAAFMTAIRDNWANLPPANVVAMEARPGGGRRAL